MDIIFATTCLVFPIALIWALSYLVQKPKSKSGHLPPGPYPLPIIGNLHQFGAYPHRSLSKLSKTYGPLMFLKAGSVNMVVASSPEMASQVLAKQDITLSGRSVPAALEVHDHYKYSIAVLGLGNEWRKIRKIYKEHLFSAHHMAAGEGLRQAKLKELLDSLTESSIQGRAVNFADVAFLTMLNVVSTMLISVELCDSDAYSIEEMWTAARGLINTISAPNLADFFPIFKRADLQGIKHQADVSIGKLLAIFQDVIDQRLRATKSTSSPKKNDILEALLELRKGEENNISIEEIKHLFVDLLVGGVDTTANIVDWTMTELLINPKKMSILKDEFRSVIGKDKQVEESDMSRLPYFQAVIKEAFRLHPPGPLLFPRKAEADTVVNGYMIPKDTAILVNMWSIGRDPSVWQNPDKFEPERFLDNKIDFRGHDFELVPFGAGRRVCPGIPLADRVTSLVLACFIHNFDWKLMPGITPETLDISEIFGLSMQKRIPLKAIPVLPSVH